MKISTYLMCAAFVGGLVAEAVTVGFFYRDRVQYPYDSVAQTSVTIDKTPLSVMQLGDEHVDTIIFSENQNEHINLNYKGIGLTVSDTAKTVSVTMPEYWRGIIIPEVSGRNMTVVIDYNRLAERLDETGQLPDFAVVKSDTFRLADIIIPRGFPIPFVKAECRRTVYVDSLTADGLCVNVPDRVVLNNCKLASFTNNAGTFNQLKLDNSYVGRASLNGVRSRFNVECLNSGPDASTTVKSHIDTLAIGKVKSRPDFNFNKADIGVVLLKGSSMNR
ncbi:MAG: hypothetical protein K2K92_01860 [Duncaniella sp.]|nr:hypothetical protein [Duncaniella sp.]